MLPAPQSGWLWSQRKDSFWKWWPSCWVALSLHVVELHWTIKSFTHHEHPNNPRYWSSPFQSAVQFTSNEKSKDSFSRSYGWQRFLGWARARGSCPGGPGCSITSTSDKICKKLLQHGFCQQTWNIYLLHCFLHRILTLTEPVLEVMTRLELRMMSSMTIDQVVWLHLLLTTVVKQ